MGTFAWNNQRHLELYFAIPCVGAVLHTLNIRLFADQLAYIANHAEDRVMFVDDSLVELMEQLAPSIEHVEHYVVMGDGERARCRARVRYEDLLEQAGAGRVRVPGDRRAPGGGPLLHERDDRQPEGRPLLPPLDQPALHGDADEGRRGSRPRRAGPRGRADVPCERVGAPARGGAGGLRPDPADRFLAAEPLARLIESERPTLMGCVPTIFADLLRYADAHPEVDLSSLKNAACGGSAVPRQLMKDFEDRHGVRVFQAWGMTETSPVATYSRPPEGVHDELYWDDRARQGRPLPWVELRILGDDDTEVAWDGESTGEIEVRGPWIASSYYKDDSGDREIRPRLASHGRHRERPAQRIGPDHGPIQGRDQVWRGVDLLG